MNFIVIGVDGARVEQGRDLVEAVPGSKTAVEPETGLGPDKVQSLALRKAALTASKVMQVSPPW